MENLSINLKPSVCLEEILLLLLLKLLWKNLHSVIKLECINTKSMGKIYLTSLYRNMPFLH